LKAPSEVREDELENLLLRLLRCPSPNPPGDEVAVVRALGEFFSHEPGITCEVFEATPNRPTLVCAVGRGKPCLALAAHVDTHPVGEGWTRDALGEVVDGAGIFGRGTTDDKGAVAAMALAFRDAAHARRGQSGRLLLIANADEETGGDVGIASLLREWEERPDAAVVAEASGVSASWEDLYVAARGTSRFTIRVRGTQTHSSLAGRPEVKSAIEGLRLVLDQMVECLELLRASHPLFGAANRMTVVRTDGGDGWGTVPGGAKADCELRVLPPARQATVEAEVRRSFQAAMDATGVDAELTFASGGLRWMSPSETQSKSPIVEAARHAWKRVHAQDPRLACFPGATDARLFEAAGIATVIIGPGALVRAHHPDEFVTREELGTAYRLYVEIVSSFLRWNPAPP
jgi:acetylornithine deacetylase/succinyl-diaminopimelate desuccinylase-like protein